MLAVVEGRMASARGARARRHLAPRHELRHVEVVAGLIVGLIESYTTQILGPGLIDIVVFALLLLMLAVRPTGLIAERREENV